MELQHTTKAMNDLGFPTYIFWKGEIFVLQGGNTERMVLGHYGEAGWFPLVAAEKFATIDLGITALLQAGNTPVAVQLGPDGEIWLLVRVLFVGELFLTFGNADGVQITLPVSGLPRRRAIMPSELFDPQGYTIHHPVWDDGSPYVVYKKDGEEVFMPVHNGLFER